jgi:hypothetical protein
MSSFFSGIVTVVNSSPPHISTGVQRNDPVERELVSGLVKISKGGQSDIRTVDGIVDNTKLLVDNYVEMGMVDIKILCDEISTISAQMTELKETLDSIAAEQLKFSQKYEALLSSKISISDDDAEKFAYSTMLIVLPISMGLLATFFGVVYMNVRV